MSKIVEDEHGRTYMIESYANDKCSNCGSDTAKIPHFAAKPRCNDCGAFWQKENTYGSGN